MSLLVDTSVWSLALRQALLGTDQVFTTGLILQELLQGFAGPKNREVLLHHFSVLACVQPNRNDHMEAAEVRNACRRRGVQIGTIDALLIQLCCRHDLTLLSTDQDFSLAAKTIDFRLWRANRAWPG